MKIDFEKRKQIQLLIKKGKNSKEICELCGISKRSFYREMSFFPSLKFYNAAQAEIEQKNRSRVSRLMYLCSLTESDKKMIDQMVLEKKDYKIIYQKIRKSSYYLQNYIRETHPDFVIVHTRPVKAIQER